MRQDRFLTSRLNMSTKYKEGAYLISTINAEINSYENLYLMCAELNIDLKNIAETDFISARLALHNFLINNLEKSVFVWFD